MKKDDILSIAVKVFGLYYCVQLVKHITDFFTILYGHLINDYQVGSWYVYLSVFILVGVDFTVAYIGVLKTDLIINKIYKPSEEVIELTLVKVDWIEIALIIIGMLAMVFSIPEILGYITDGVYLHNHQESPFFTIAKKNEIYTSIFKLGTGFFLLLNARNFSKMIVKRGELDDKIDEQNI